MANLFDFEEQEQFDQLRNFWKNYGRLITGALILVLCCVAAWNAYGYWQQSRSTRACALFDELDKAAAGSADLKKVEQVFADVKAYAATTCADHSAFLAAKAFYAAGHVSAVQEALQWITENSKDKAYVTLARLRWSAVLLESKAYDQALAVVDKDADENFAALVADRKGDIYTLQGKSVQARAEYQKALSLFESRVEYRQLVDAKLNALGTFAPQSARDGAQKQSVLK